MSFAGGAGVVPRLADIKRSQPMMNNVVSPLMTQHRQRASLRMSTLNSLGVSLRCDLEDPSSRSIVIPSTRYR
jgi:hypothetical protein